MKRREVETLANIAALVAVYKFLRAALSYDVRQELIKRDGYRCTECGFDHKLEAAHYNHDKSDPNYNTPDAARMLCVVHHYLDHYYNYENNGLSSAHNKMALVSLWSRVPEAAKSKYRMPPPEQWGKTDTIHKEFITSMADAFKRSYADRERRFR